MTTNIFEQLIADRVYKMDCQLIAFGHSDMVISPVWINMDRIYHESELRNNQLEYMDVEDLKRVLNYDIANTTVESSD